MVIKAILPLVFLFFGTFSQAQQGMQFLEAGSWEEVLTRAKKENKPIFLDAYTTWCGPCIMMAKKVFPLPEVGAFYNANYINVKVQLDTTSRDSDKVKKWYKDAHYLMTTYGINAFPTYIFFSPDGEALHREIGASDAEKFIAKGRNALNPDKQYYRLTREFNQGNRDTDFLRKLIKAATDTYDNANVPVYAKAFYNAKPDLLAPENIELVMQLTKTSEDTGFVLMQQYPEKFDGAVKKQGTAKEAVLAIILQEEFYPNLNDGENLLENIDWEGLKKNVAKKYPSYAYAATLRAKVMYYRVKEDFPAFTEAVTTLLNFEGETALEPQMLNGFAWMVFEKCDDLHCIMHAIGWSKKSVELEPDPMFMDTYANLLHKSGNTHEAIRWQKKAIELLKEQGEDTDEYEETLQKMEKGEKTWQ
jgi:thiol-disulfide isomerase/thioredoxin